MDPALLQCLKSHGYGGAAVLGGKNQMHSSCSHCICQTLHPVTFCHSLTKKWGFEINFFLLLQMQCSSQPWHHTQGVSNSACSMEKPVEQGCVCRRDVLGGH